MLSYTPYVCIEKLCFEALLGSYAAYPSLKHLIAKLISSFMSTRIKERGVRSRRVQLMRAPHSSNKKSLTRSRVRSLAR